MVPFLIALTFFIVVLFIIQTGNKNKTWTPSINDGKACWISAIPAVGLGIIGAALIVPLLRKKILAEEAAQIARYDDCEDFAACIWCTYSIESQLSDAIPTWLPSCHYLMPTVCIANRGSGSFSNVPPCSKWGSSPWPSPSSVCRMQKAGDMESGPKEEIMVDGKPVLATVTGVTDIDEANAANANVSAVEQADVCAASSCALCTELHASSAGTQFISVSARAHDPIHVQQPPMLLLLPGCICGAWANT